MESSCQVKSLITQKNTLAAVILGEVLKEYTSLLITFVRPDKNMLYVFLDGRIISDHRMYVSGSEKNGYYTVPVLTINFQ